MTDESSARRARLKGFAGGLNKRFGEGTVSFNLKPMKLPRLSTGSVALDLALGGGLPYGRVTEVVGHRSSGKTTLVYRAAGLAQKLCANCLRPVYNLEVKSEDGDVDAVTGEVEQVFYMSGECDCASKGLWIPRPLPHHYGSATKKSGDAVGSLDEKSFKQYREEMMANSYVQFNVCLFDVEGAFDSDWARAIGFDGRLISYSRPDTAEEVVDTYDVILRSGGVDLIILDSIAAMTPGKEIEASAEDWQQGLAARINNKWIRKAGSAVNAVAREWHRIPTQLWINQIRKKIGVMYGSPDVKPGGEGQGFASSVEIKCWASDHESKDVSGDAGINLGTKVTMNCKVVKNKTGPAQTTCSYVMHISGDNKGRVEQAGYMVKLLTQFGLVKQQGTNWFLGEQKFSTKGALCDQMVNNPKEFERLRLFLLQKLVW